MAASRYVPTIEHYVTSDQMIHSPPKTTITVYFDGLCQPINPGGIACYAFIIKNGENTIYREYGLGAHDSTNNVAEYTAIIKALEWLLANNYKNENIVIKGDSRLVINQIERKFKVKAPTIIPLYQRVMFLVSKFNHIQFQWIPREENKEADKLTCRAYEEIMQQRMSYDQTRRRS
jgi:ribonuclease HI